MPFVEMLGWAAAGATVVTYGMRTMLPLRIAAILSSLLFLIYGILIDSVPLIAMELTLLPFNIWRLWQILDMRRKVRGARRGGTDTLALLRQVGSARAMPAGTTIFQQGDRPDYLYVVLSGEVELEELGITLGKNDIFGEIAFFTEAHARTATARCLTECRIHAVDEEAFLRLYFLNPTFALALMKLITRRLVEGVAQRPEIYCPATTPTL